VGLQTIQDKIDGQKKWTRKIDRKKTNSVKGWQYSTFLIQLARVLTQDYYLDLQD